MEFMLIAAAVAAAENNRVAYKEEIVELDQFFAYRGKANNGLKCCFCKKSIDYKLFYWSERRRRPAHFSCALGKNLCIVKQIARDGRKNVLVYNRATKRWHNNIKMYTVNSKGAIIRYRPVNTYCCKRKSDQSETTKVKKKHWILPFCKKKRACNLCGHTFRACPRVVFYSQF